MLYLRTPYLRGDDVVDLQRRLSALGFDAGRVDGMFGLDTDRALRAFQRNAGLAVDGICGTKTVLSLHRLRSKGPESDPAAVRESVRWSTAPATPDGSARRAGRTGGLGGLPTRGAADAHRAGRHRNVIIAPASRPSWLPRPTPPAAQVYVGFALARPATDAAPSYWGAHGTISPAGRRLAGLVLDELSISGAGTDGPPVPMATPILRETRMPAVMVELGPPRFVVERAAVAAQRRSVVE